MSIVSWILIICDMVWGAYSNILSIAERAGHILQYHDLNVYTALLKNTLVRISSSPNSLSIWVI